MQDKDPNKGDLKIVTFFNAKSSAKELMQIIGKKPKTTSIHQKIHNTCIKINIFNDSTNFSEKNNIKHDSIVE